jgi:hypothetical protein
MRLAPQLASDISVASLFGAIQQSRATTSHIQVKFTATQLKAIRAMADLEATNRISTSDALIGYLVTVLNRISPVAIEHIISILNVSLGGLLFSINIHANSS